MKRSKLILTLALVLVAGGVGLASVQADTAPSNFSLQITPSPLVTTVKPGQTTNLTLKIRNGGDGTEKLKIEPRSFKFDSATGQVQLSDDTPTDVASWITFGQKNFTVQPGEWYSESVKISLPKDSGFSYSFALVISRQSVPKATSEGRLIEGSVADFTLVNVDRPGATSKLSVAKFSSSKRLYQYLPATLNVTFANSGNTIVQPSGNIFISRNANAKTPMATLAVNKNDSYILPGTSRTLSNSWADGFQVYKTTTAADGTSKTHLSWYWNKLSSLRIGRYTAQLVAVYNDGQRDVPVQGQVTFWVVPWVSILLILVVIVGLVLLVRWRGKRRTEKAVKRALAAQKVAQKRAAEKTEVRHDS